MIRRQSEQTRLGQLVQRLKEQTMMGLQLGQTKQGELGRKMVQRPNRFQVVAKLGRFQWMMKIRKLEHRRTRIQFHRILLLQQIQMMKMVPNQLGQSSAILDQLEQGQVQKFQHASSREQ
jgi:hypothetical protein